MKILITGGAGFIGKRLALRLLDEQHSVTILDNFSSQVHPNDTAFCFHPDIQILRGDVTDRTAWRNALRGNSAVIHLAAETGTGQSMYEIARYEQVNIGGTAFLYDELFRQRNHGIERIVIASSRAVYGEGAYWCNKDGQIYPASRSLDDKLRGAFEPTCPICGCECHFIATPEDAPLRPLSFYGLTKQVQDQMASVLGRSLGISSFVLRFQNVYGPGQSPQNPYTGILAIFASLARFGSEIEIFEDGQQRRDFIYVDDVVDAIIKAVTSSLTGIHTLNIGSGKTETVFHVAEIINTFFGNRSPLRISGAFRDGDIRSAVADLGCAEAMLRFRPTWSLVQGLETVLKEFSGSEDLTVAYKRSLEELRKLTLLRSRNEGSSAH